MAKTKAQLNEEAFDRAMKNITIAQQALWEEREQCLTDRRFYSIAGAQWEDRIGEQFENKPKFEFNKIHLSVIRIINDYRNNRITVKFVDKFGDKSNAFADVCNDLFRADSQDSSGEEAADNAFEEAVGGGFGSLRLRTEYVDEYDLENHDKRILVEPIYDADSSVYFDINAKKQDKSDAKWGVILTAMAREAYKEKYGDDPSSIQKNVEENEFDWATPDVVYVGEYYEIEEVRTKHYYYQTLTGEEVVYSDEEHTEELEDVLIAQGDEFQEVRTIKERRVHKRIMNGERILEDCGFIDGKCIPIVPNYGKRWYVDNVERCMGHVRLAADAQRLKNMQMSWLAEISSFSPREKPIFLPEQISNHGEAWANDNIEDYAFLTIDPIKDAEGNSIPSGPVDYTRPASVPPSLAALLQLTEADMKEILGNQTNREEIVSGISGKAVELINTRLDMQSFIYMSNMAKCMRRVGQVWLSMAKDVYTRPGRKMKSLGPKDEINTVEIMKPVKSDAGMEYENDFSDATFDVAVSVGPTSDSKRQATVRAISDMLAITSDPETQQVLQAIALMNMEGEGIEDAREYFRKKLVSMGVIEPTQEEQEQAAQAAAAEGSTPQDELIEAATREAHARADEAEAKAVHEIAKTQKTQAETQQTEAETGKTIAETAETVTDIQDKDIKTALELDDRAVGAGTSPEET